MDDPKNNVSGGGLQIEDGAVCLLILGLHCVQVRLPVVSAMAEILNGGVLTLTIIKYSERSWIGMIYC